MTEGEIGSYGLESVDSNGRSGGLGIMWMMWSWYCVVFLETY